MTPESLTVHQVRCELYRMFGDSMKGYILVYEEEVPWGVGKDRKMVNLVHIALSGIDVPPVTPVCIENVAHHVHELIRLAVRRAQHHEDVASNIRNRILEITLKRL